MLIDGERGAYVTASHSASGYSSGVTYTTDLYIESANVIVHVGLARFAASSDVPGGATIGISEYVFTDDNGQGQTRTFADEADWETAVYQENVSLITIAAYVYQGEMKGWWSLLVYE